MNSSNNILHIFHALIIASFLFSLSGCGYKASPYYEKSTPKEDENVKFILEKKKFPAQENNETCE